MKVIKNVLLVVLSFFIAYELVSELSKNEKILGKSEIDNNYVFSKTASNAYFLGDSYASTNYVEDPYPNKFKSFFKSKGINFYDYSKAGSELNLHKKILDSIGKTNPEIIIYFYNLGDIVSLNSEILVMDHRNSKIDSSNTKKNVPKKNILSRVYQSHSMTLIKEVMHFFSLKFTGNYVSGTPAFKMPIENFNQRKELEKYFNSINGKNIIIVINSHFNVEGDIVKKWKHYNMFKSLKLKPNITLIQTVDIVDDPKFGVSWRNGHPNQEAISIVFDRIREIISLKLEQR